MNQDLAGGKYHRKKGKADKDMRTNLIFDRLKQVEKVRKQFTADIRMVESRPVPDELLCSNACSLHVATCCGRDLIRLDQEMLEPGPQICRDRQLQACMRAATRPTEVHDSSLPMCWFSGAGVTSTIPRFHTEIGQMSHVSCPLACFRCLLISVPGLSEYWCHAPAALTLHSRRTVFCGALDPHQKMNPW